MKIPCCTPLFVALTLSACAHDASPPAPLKVIAGELGDTRFEASRTQTQASGYEVQSGNLIGPQGIAGGMVMVTAPDGAVTAFIQRDGHSGMLQLDTSGKRTFTPEAEVGYHHDFEVQEPAVAADARNPAADQAYTIDAMAGFTAKALEGRDIDPLAYALGQVESVNLSLRNSLLGGIEMHLAGVFITNEDIPVTGGSGGGRERWEQLLTPLRASYYHDINGGFSIGGDAGGYATRPGFTSVNLITAPTAFKHEVGHNVGGSHCYPDQGDTYQHGFDAGDGFRTNLCGNSRPYYSNPEVTVDGRVIGDAQTADMGRLWREQASRLTSYSPAFSGLRMIYTSHQPDAGLSITFQTPSSQAGVVALDQRVGPTTLVYGSHGVTMLAVALEGPDGQVRVNFRAQRQVNGCEESTTMNSYHLCHPDSGGGMRLVISYHAEDNPRLDLGWYSGAVQLKAVDIDNPDWSVPILLSLAVKR